jgi:hypothetical protein
MCEAPGHSIELIEYSGPDDHATVRPRACDTGFCHVAYDVVGLDELIDAAAVRGAPGRQDHYHGSGSQWGARIVYLHDTDRITFEFIEKPI